MFKLFFILLPIVFLPILGTAQETTNTVTEAAKEYDLANIAYAKNSPEEAYNHLQKAADLDPNNAPYLNSAGFLAYQYGDFDKAINYLERALILDKAYYGDNHPAVASLMNNLGAVWSKKGDQTKALFYLDQALSLMTEDLGPDHPQTKSVQAKRDEVAATVN